MVNSSRLIGSSDGLQMQQQALAQVANSSKQGVDEANAGVQTFLKSAAENSRSLVELQNAKAQAEAANASRPTALQQIAQAGLSIYADIRKQENAAEAKQLEEQQALKRSAMYTQASDKLNDLLGEYESSNWRNGVEAYKYEASKLLSQFTPASKEDIQDYQELVKQVQENYTRRNRVIGDKLDESQTELTNQKAAVEREVLRGRLQPILFNISNQTLDQEAKPLLDNAIAQLNQWRAADNGLPDAKKLSIISGILNEMYDRYGEKLNRYTQYTGKLNDLRSYSNEFSLAQAQYAAGQLTLEQFKQKEAELNQRYPGNSQSVVRLGDQEKLLLDLRQTSQSLQELGDKAANRELANATFDDQTVASIAANAYFDPGFASQIELDPGLKENPRIQFALRLAKQRQEFDNDNASLSVETAQAATQIARLNLQNAEQVINLNKQLALRQANGQQLSVQELMQQELLNRVAADNPQLAALLAQAQNQPKQINKEQLQSALSQYASGINGIRDALVQEQQAKSAAVLTKYQELQRFGLLTDRDTLFNYAQNAQPLLQKVQEETNRRRLEVQQQYKQPYGLQPNFNPSSTHAPTVDDGGNLVLVPRQQAQTIKLSDGSQIVTPVAAGTSAPLSQGGHFGAPRTYRNGIHYGQDFGLGKGAKAISLISGTVLHVGQADGYGNFVDILGDNGVVYRYGHQAALVKPGQRVLPGQQVSYSDGSGVGSPHLHFEVRPNPVFVNGRYDISRNYGSDGAIDPLKHLQQLNAGSSTVLRPRGDTSAFRHDPSLKAPANSTLASNGGVVYANTYQRVGSVAAPSVQRFSPQRPLRTGSTPAKVRVGQIQPDFGDDMGYAELRKDPGLMRAFHDTAARLGIPSQWIVDIVRQESGGIQPYKDHNGNNYGLFGFGNDSFNDKNIHARLRAGKIDAAGQLQLYERYLRENGWDKLIKQKQGNLSIADVWAFTRMGWNDRQRFWKTGDMSIQASKSIRMTYADELKLLGKWVGRQYDLNDRSSRNAPVGGEFLGSCAVCNQLQASLSDFIPHAHNIG